MKFYKYAIVCLIALLIMTYIDVDKEDVYKEYVYASNEIIIDMLNFILENDFKIKNGLIKDTLAVEILVSKYCQRNVS